MNRRTAPAFSSRHTHSARSKPSAASAWAERRSCSTAKRARPQAPVAASDGVVVPAKGHARAAVVPPESAPQPLASSSDIRMPWESTAPARAQPIITTPGAASRRSGSMDVKMPWDPPGGRPAPSDAFAAELGDDKGLDEVILEYLSDDSETEER